MGVRGRLVAVEEVVVRHDLGGRGQEVRRDERLRDRLGGQPPQLQGRLGDPVAQVPRAHQRLDLLAPVDDVRLAPEGGDTPPGPSDALVEFLSAPLRPLMGFGRPPRRGVGAPVVGIGEGAGRLVDAQIRCVRCVHEADTSTVLH